MSWFVMELDDTELGVLSQILWEEVDANRHEPSRRSEEDLELASSLHSKVIDEAKKRKLWWAW